MRYRVKPQWFIIPTILGGFTWFFSNNFSIGLSVFVIFLLPFFMGVYIPYAKDNPKHLWFKRKLYGWGWTPVTWQGWLTTGIYVALLTAFSLTVNENSSQTEMAFTFGLPILFLTVTFIRIAYLKGEKPKWQWGR